MAESEKAYNFAPNFFIPDNFSSARYRGANYFVALERAYHERSYRPVLDDISCCHISDQEDTHVVPWFYFEYHSQNMFFIAGHDLYTERDIVEWFDKATPEEIDEVALEIKEAEESLSREGLNEA